MIGKRCCHWLLDDAVKPKGGDGGGGDNMPVEKVGKLPLLPPQFGPFEKMSGSKVLAVGPSSCALSFASSILFFDFETRF